jgi:hypothetical protein
MDDRTAQLIDSSRGKFGITIKSGVRYYPEPNFYPEGVFFGAELRFKQYNSTLKYTAFDGSGERKILDYQRHYTDLLAIFGYQADLGGSIFGEIYSGIGVRLKRAELPKDGKNAQGYLVYIPVLDSVNLSDLTLGLKIGMAF